jgi:hypothetical protein
VDVETATEQWRNFGNSEHQNGLLDLVSTVDEELKDLASQQSRLRQLQSTLTRVKHQSLNSLAPVNSLHPELLGLIFSEVLACHALVSGSDVFEERSTEVEEGKIARLSAATLSSVCSYWRRLAIDNNSFLSYIPITSTNQLVTRAQTYLHRARMAPIDVFLTTQRCKTPFQKPTSAVLLLYYALKTDRSVCSPST